ncbi:MAG: sulfatase [Planctomycetota bacterium]
MRLLAVPLFSALFGVLSACSPQPAGESASGGVLLVAIDSLRADHVTCYGYDRATTPVIDALAGEGVRFSNAWSAAPAILPSNAALLSGCDPRIAQRVLPPDVQGTTLSYWSLPREAPHLAQELLGTGHATAAFVDHPQLGPALGLARGFEEFQGVPRSDEAVVRRPSPEELAERFSSWIASRAQGERWFAFLHFGGLEGFGWDPAEPWEHRFAPRPGLESVPPVGDGEHVFHALPRSRWSGGARSLGEHEASYDGAIARIDAAIGVCIDSLRRRGLLGDTTVVVCGTRGISFGESGLIGDSGTLDPVDLSVPLVIRPAAGRRFDPGATRTAVASLVDVAPTVLSLCGAPVPPDMQGVSLAPALSDDATRPRRLAFAGCALFEGWLACGEDFAFEQSEPWTASSELLVRSWYGGPPPEVRAPHMVLSRRAASQPHARLAPAAFDERVATLAREGFASWDAEVEALRGRLHPNDWDRARE